LSGRKANAIEHDMVSGQLKPSNLILSVCWMLLWLSPLACLEAPRSLRRLPIKHECFRLIRTPIAIVVTHRSIQNGMAIVSVPFLTPRSSFSPLGLPSLSTFNNPTGATGPTTTTNLAEHSFCRSMNNVWTNLN